jgi:catechol 2,3-dioxygenase-like lactoylglutathione lyase family enzyme
MSYGFRDIDHLMIRVADLDEGIKTFESLGFFVAPARTPFDMTPLAGDDDSDAAKAKKAPIENRHVVMHPYPGRDDIANFFELMHFDTLNSPPSVVKTLCFMLDTEGPKTIVCYAEDIEASCEAMREDGLEVNLLAAKWEIGWEHDGEWIPTRGRPAPPIFGGTPFQVNPFETVDLPNFSYDPWRHHPNTARYMAGVTGVTNQIKEHTQHMAERVFGVEPEWKSEDIAVITPRDIYLRIVTPAGFAELYPGLDFSRERVLPTLTGVTVAVESLETLRKTLNKGDVEHHDTPSGGVVVPRTQAANTVIEFVPAAA